MELTRKLIRTENDFNQMIEETKDSIKIAFDTENGSELALNPKYAKPVGFSISVDGKRGYYIPINHLDIKTNFHLRFKELLVNKKLIIFWNAIYDAGITSAHYNEDLYKYKWFDCMIAQHLIDAFQSKGLKYNTKRYFRIHQQEFKWKDMLDTNAADVYQYACDDAIYTFKHYLRLKEEIKKQHMENLILNIEGEFLKVLTHMKLQGIKFNVDECKQLEQRLIKDKINIVNEILNVTPEITYIQDLLGGKKPNINLDSNKDLVKLLYDKLNLPVKKQTASGAPAADSEAFELMKDNFNEWLHPICPLLIKYKEVQKLLSAYTKSLYEKVVDGRIYGDLLDHGTESGRLSAREPNLQQLPKNDTYKIRHLFKASEGYKMYVSDFSQEELRLAGHITKCKAFLKAFNNEEDLHLRVASESYNLNIPEECLIGTHPQYNSYKDKYYKERFYAKSINFGLLYGRTAHGLAPQLNCSVEEAQAIVNNYFYSNPEIKQAMENSKREVQVKGYVENIYGRKRRFNKAEKNGRRFYPKECFRQAFNHKIQGGCADMLRIIMVEIYKYVREQPKDEIRIITTVHDEIMFEIKDNINLQKHREMIDKIMTETIKLDIKLSTDGKLGNNYGECK